MQADEARDNQRLYSIILCKTDWSKHPNSLSNHRHKFCPGTGSIQAFLGDRLLGYESRNQSINRSITLSNLPPWPLDWSQPRCDWSIDVMHVESELTQSVDFWPPTAPRLPIILHPSWKSCVRDGAQREVALNGVLQKDEMHMHISKPQRNHWTMYERPRLLHPIQSTRALNSGMEELRRWKSSWFLVVFALQLQHHIRDVDPNWLDWECRRQAITIGE